MSELERVISFYYPQNPALHSGDGLPCLELSGKWLKCHGLCLALKQENSACYSIKEDECSFCENIKILFGSLSH